jgi:hypothetical protein
MEDAFELKGSNGHALRVTVLRYQFPAETRDSLNWLLVRIDATRAGRGSWTATDPSLETHELRALADWLEALAAGRESSPRLYFTEPNLELGLCESADGVSSLQVHFALESRPPWVTRGHEDDADASVEFPLVEVDLEGFAQWARRQRERFPPREPEDSP